MLYIGSTSNFSRRRYAHKRNSKSDENRVTYTFKLYQKIRENGGWDNCIMEIIDTIECDDKNDVRQKEQEWIDNVQSNLNSIVSYANMSKQEMDIRYYNENIEKFKKYRMDNKDKISSSRKEHYYSNHERKLEIARTYREKNPDKVIECNKKQIEMPPLLCECGVYYTYKHKTRHLSTKKHINSTR